MRPTPRRPIPTQGWQSGKGRAAQLSYRATVLMEDRHGLAVGTCTTPATGQQSRQRGDLVTSAQYRRQRITVGADKGFDPRGAWRTAGGWGGPPCGAAHDGPRQCHRRPDVAPPGIRGQPAGRKRVEEIFGWLKTIGLCRQTRFPRADRVGWMVTFATASYNLVRMRTPSKQPRHEATPLGGGACRPAGPSGKTGPALRTELAPNGFEPKRHATKATFSAACKGQRPRWRVRALHHRLDQFRVLWRRSVTERPPSREGHRAAREGPARRRRRHRRTQSSTVRQADVLMLVTRTPSPSPSCPDSSNAMPSAT